MTNVILFLVTDQVLVLIIIATVPTAIRNTKAKWIIDRPPPLPPFQFCIEFVGGMRETSVFYGCVRFLYAPDGIAFLTYTKLLYCS